MGLTTKPGLNPGLVVMPDPQMLWEIVDQDWGWGIVDSQGVQDGRGRSTIPVGSCGQPGWQGEGRGQGRMCGTFVKINGVGGCVGEIHNSSGKLWTARVLNVAEADPQFVV